MRKPLDSSTEEKIKTAARKVFIAKGYAATRTRDIAEESGINLALLNYYFRSKENLHSIILQESLLQFRKGLHEIINNNKTTLLEKTKAIVATYSHTLLAEPGLALFVLTELKHQPQISTQSIEEATNFSTSILLKQLTVHCKKKKLSPSAPLHFLTNIYALTIFPFLGKPMLASMSQLNSSSFKKLITERETLIPVWIQQQFLL